MRLDGKYALVTGGGRGIGKGITDCLLAAGATVMVVQRQPLPEDLQQHQAVVYTQADLSQKQTPGLIAKAVATHFDRLDILVNNAGIMFEQSLEEMDEESWDNMMNVNLRAPVFITKALLPRMRETGGSIINVGSIEGIGANPWHIAYCGSKAGVHGYTRAMAVDLGQYNIRCNAIAPGWINTDLSDQYINSQPDPLEASHKLQSLHPVGRTGEPDDIGKTAVFLASDQSAFITGQVLVVDGGRTVKLPLPF